MSEWIDFNLNHYVKVKMTESGYKMYHEYYNQFNPIKNDFTHIKSLRETEDEYGFVKMQMHVLMNIFGTKMLLGFDLPIELNIKFQNPKHIQEL